MVIVILKDGYVFGFEMDGFDKEEMLVEHFNNKNLSKTTVLDLKSKGQFKVGDIQGMEFQPVRAIKRKS